MNSTIAYSRKKVKKIKTFMMQDALVRELHIIFCEVWALEELVTKKIKSGVNSLI